MASLSCILYSLDIGLRCIQIYFFKTLIPISGLLVLLQGIAEAVRCTICIKTGEWPPRLHDVQETETMLMNEQADLRKLEKENE